MLSFDRHVEAEGLARQALATDPQSALFLAQLAQSLIGQNKGEEALQAAKGLVALQPGFAEAHRMLSIGYAQLHRGRLAERSARQAVALDPEEAVFHLMVGNLYGPSLGQRGKAVAREAYAEALRLNPESAEALRGLTETSATPVKFAKTVAGLRQSLELDPTDPKAAYGVLADELRRVLFWLRALAVVVFVFSAIAHGAARPLGRFGVFALLAIGFGCLGKISAQLSAGERRLVAGALRRKPGLALIAIGVTAFFAMGGLWALTGADWTVKPVVWSWTVVLAGIVFRYYWNVIRLPFMLLWLFVLKLRAGLPIRRPRPP